MNWFLYCTWVSFCRVDLCHQADDDDDYEGSFCDNPLLEKTSNESNLASIDSHRKCFPFWFARVGNRQKIVILVWETMNVSCVVLIFIVSFFTVILSVV